MFEKPKMRDEILRDTKGVAGDLLITLIALKLRDLAKEESSAQYRV
ncbi:MAG TPA: hypothetical protein VNF51_01455 [Candidatus Paceibacterota bacterium]|nr:hypothetical protein [Candidatus Paceibacterota bacterium]